MYVRTTKQVRVDSEILVMYQPDRGFSGECMEDVSVVCARSAHQSVVRRDLTCFMGGHGGVPVVLLFLRAQIN